MSTCLPWGPVGSASCCEPACTLGWPSGAGFSSPNISARRLSANDNTGQNPRIFNWLHCNTVAAGAPNEYYKWTVTLPGAYSQYNAIITETIRYTDTNGAATVANRYLYLDTYGYGRVKLYNGTKGQIFTGKLKWATTNDSAQAVGTIATGCKLYCGINTKLCTNCTNEFNQTNTNVYYVYCSSLAIAPGNAYYAPFFWIIDCGPYVIRFSPIPSSPYTITESGSAPTGSRTWNTSGGLQHYCAWNRNLCPNPSQGSTLCMSAAKAEIHWKGAINYSSSPYYGYNSFGTLTSHNISLDPRTSFELNMGGFAESMTGWTRQDWDKTIPTWPPAA